MRVYVPATAAMLRTLVEQGRLTGPLLGCAVTPELAAAYDGADADELEFVALLHAAARSAGLLSSADVPRRVVVAADVEQVGPAPSDDDPAAVLLVGEVLLDQVAALHVDEPQAGPAVAAAVAAGELEALDDLDLLWFATQELPAVIGDLSAGR